MTNIRKGFSQLLRGSIIGRLLGASGNIALSRVLSLVNFGSFSLYLQLIQTAEALSRLGLDYSIGYWVAPDPSLRFRRSKILLQTGLLLSVLFASITLLGFSIYLSLPNSSFPLAGQLDNLSLNFLVLSALAIECFSSIPWEILLIQRKINSYSLRIAFFGPLKIIFAVIGAGSMQLTGAIGGWFIGSSLQLLWLASEVPFHLIWNRTYPESLLRSAKALLSKAVPFYSGNLLGQIVFFPLLIALSSSTGVGSVGIVRISQIFAQIFGILGGALVPILFVSMRSTKSPEQKSAQLKRAVEAIWAISLVLFSIFCILDAPLTIKFFGAEYARSIPVTRVLVSCVIIDSIAQIIQQSLLVHGKVIRLALTQNVSAVLSALVGFILIPYFGINGYLACRLLYSFLPGFVTLILARRIMLSFSIDWKLAISAILMILIIVNSVHNTYSPHGLVERSLFLVIFLLSLTSGLQQSWIEYKSRWK